MKDPLKYILFYSNTDFFGVIECLVSLIYLSEIRNIVISLLQHSMQGTMTTSILMIYLLNNQLPNRRL